MIRIMHSLLRDVHRDRADPRLLEAVHEEDSHLMHQGATVDQVYSFSRYIWLHERES